MIDATSAMYDSLAEHYRSYSSNRSAYIFGVDQFILASVRPLRPSSLLDVGAGDGVRGTQLAKELGITHTVLFDGSPEMVARCKALGASQVVLGKAEQLPAFDRKFDLVVMLWNVLGHLEGRESRIAALRGIAASMTKDSCFFLDVNNRHNGASYGWWKVAGRVLIDSIWPDESRGDVSYSWVVNGQSIPGKGHLFTMSEVRGLLQSAGLEVRDQVFIDYVTGVASKNRYRGQIVLKVGLA
jgi:hypothetical protein